jgi:effector-binding domain-containing protein
MNTEQNQTESNEIQPLGVLFGILAYSDIDEYEAFINRLNEKSAQDMMLTIHSALRYAQAKGVFSLEESEAISIVLRKFKN